MKKHLSRRPDIKIAAIGGGTGLSTMLRGLKHISPSVTAIVTVMDNGGGSGVLRQELGMLPPGDIRNCLQALANTEPTMEALLAYRFPNGALRGQSFGNLFLAALNGMCATFDEAVARMSEVLAITGRVLPVTNENVQLLADFDDGVTVTGESQIADYKKTSRGGSCGSISLRSIPQRSPPVLTPFARLTSSCSAPAVSIQASSRIFSSPASAKRSTHRTPLRSTL